MLVLYLLVNEDHLEMGRFQSKLMCLLKDTYLWRSMHVPTNVERDHSL